MIKGYNAAVAT